MWDPVKEAKKVLKKVENLGKDIENKAKAGVNDVRTKGQWYIKTVENKGKAAVHEAEKAANTVKNEGESAVNTVKNEGKKIADECVKEIDEKGKAAIAELETTFEERLPELLKNQVSPIATSILHDIEGNAEMFATELQKSLLGPGLYVLYKGSKTIYDLLGEVVGDDEELKSDLNSIGGELRIACVKGAYSGIYDRLELIHDVLKFYTENPISMHREQICNFFTSIAPDTFAFPASISANVVVVGSKLLEIEGSLNAFPSRLGIKLMDKILEAAGVPK